MELLDRGANQTLVRPPELRQPGDPAPEKLSFRFVSLGSDCQPAMQIEAVQRGTLAGLFDNITTEIRHLSRLIRNDFAGFLDRENLFPVYFEQELRGVVDTVYRVGMNHHFAGFDDASIQAVQDVFRMRIRWFRNLFDPRRPPPYFVRRWHPRDGSDDESSAIALFHQLRHMRRDIRFLYLHPDPQRPDFMMDGYRSAYLRQIEPFVWYGDTVAWRRVLTDFARRPFEGDREAFELPPYEPPRGPRFG